MFSNYEGLSPPSSKLSTLTLPASRRRIGDQIDATIIFARKDFVNMITLQSVASKESGAERELGEVSGLGIAASMSGKEPARTKRC